MLRLLSYILGHGTVTQTERFPLLKPYYGGLPDVVPAAACQGDRCLRCLDVCPTSAIKVIANGTENPEVVLDLGACIGCGMCISRCPAGVFVRDLSTATAVRSRKSLLRSNQPVRTDDNRKPASVHPFRNSLAVRVVSTGCSACDLEISAAGNPIFDMERFGVHIVASPRGADALLVTGPAGRGMQDALKRTYEAMAEPRLVIAAGACAISGGVHPGGYADANGIDGILPVDAFIPGCPPHPWSVIHGLLIAAGRVEETRKDPPLSTAM